MSANKQLAFSRRDNFATEHRQLSNRALYFLNVRVTIKTQNIYLVYCVKEQISNFPNVSTGGLITASLIN